MSNKNKHIDFYDETLRDGPQSLWGMRMTMGMVEAVAEEIDQAGYEIIMFHLNPVYFQIAVRWGEDPWETMRLLKRKIKKTKLGSICFPGPFTLDRPYEPPAVWKLYYKKIVETSGQRNVMFMSNTSDEIDKYFPEWFKFCKEVGLETTPTICYYPSPRTDDDSYFVNVTKKVLKFKPDRIYLKDAGGLLTTERVKTLLPALLKETRAQGVPMAIHTHGVSTNAGRVLVEAMEMGIDKVTTCIPPLAYGSSHTSIFNAIHNAELLGRTHNMNIEPLKVVEDRLTRIAKQENLPIGAPLEYDHGVYMHQVPGGVMGTLKNQLNQMSLLHKLDEVLEEVPHVLKDLGYPIMITPFSQYVVSQATVNVVMGERYKEILDPLIEMALGVWGLEDSGAAYMDQNLKDRILSNPNAKKVAEKWERDKEEAESDKPIEYYKAQYDMSSASDEEFLLHYIMKGDAEINKMRALKGKYTTYYTGKDPLVVLLDALKKDKDISHLTMQKGKSFFEFRQS